MVAYPARRLQRTDAQPADARRLRIRGRLCPGGAPAPRIARRIAGRDGWARRDADRDPALGGGEDRRSAEMGPLRQARLYDAVQRRRLPGDFGVRRLWRRWAAGGDPARGQTVSGTDPVPRRRRLREGHPVPRPAARPGWCLRRHRRRMANAFLGLLEKPKAWSRSRSKKRIIAGARVYRLMAAEISKAR